MNKYLYCQIMVFLDLRILLFKPLTAFGGLKNKFPQVLKHHNLAIEVFIDITWQLIDKKTFFLKSDPCQPILVINQLHVWQQSALENISHCIQTYTNVWDILDLSGPISL